MLKAVLPKIGSLDIKTEEKFIVHIDLNVNHKDNFIRGFVLKKRDQIKYLSLLEKYLLKLKKIFGKKFSLFSVKKSFLKKYNGVQEL